MGTVQQRFKSDVSGGAGALRGGALRGGVLREAPKAGIDQPDRCQPRAQRPLFLIVSRLTVAWCIGKSELALQ